MLYNHTTESVVTREQIIGALPSISRKSTATDEQLIKWADEHLGWHVSEVQPFNTPEGMVATGPMTVVVLDGVAYKHFETITQEEYDAQVAAQQAAQAAAYAAYIAAIAPSALLYATTLRTYFPDLDPPAEQNTAITQDVVKQYFIGERQAGTMDVNKVADSVLLSSLFDTLVQPDGTTWSLPWNDIWATQA